ncbi:hypothetical protein SAMIE_1015480 [Sphingobium amiense]|uniref:Uncharacterized protein n=1 Tax=Sphingobium amiense TaxID=135719 RepID=A0A494W670_9SPHN|nr:hypothetical protein [Sphingobium amiense]BBD98047.1 hypothetical protein SAMIE_1015480 [Sphingobium amiense]
MPETLAAIRKVEAALMEAIAVRRPDLQGFADRSTAEPLSEGEWPGYSVRHEVKFNLSPEMGQFFNDALFTFEVQSGNTTDATLDQINQLAVSDINDALQADPTLGGMVEDVEPIGSDSSQPESADVGSAVLQVRVTYYTLIRSHSTIVGHGGQLFT